MSKYKTFGERPDANHDSDAKLGHNCCQRQRLDGLASALWQSTDTSNNDAASSVRFQNRIPTPQCFSTPW